jgi:hypothetical protein
LTKAIEANREFICAETLAERLDFNALSETEANEVEIGDEKIKLTVRRT